MSKQQLTALDIFKRLNKSNCGDCGLPTCMAFASLVIQKGKIPADCPHLEVGNIEYFNGMIEEKHVAEQHMLEIPTELKARISKVDFHESTERLKARVKDNAIAVRCLGKEFMLDQNGELRSECHANFWVQVPLLNYVYLCKGKELKGDWLKFDQLRDAISFSNYFNTRCENELRKICDRDCELFFDIMQIFGGTPVKQEFSADYAVEIFPLPRVPFLVCYWKPDGEFDSQFSLYFDRSVNDNLDIESLYVLGMGIVEMMRKVMARHEVLSAKMR